MAGNIAGAPVGDGVGDGVIGAGVGAGVSDCWGGTFIDDVDGDGGARLIGDCVSASDAMLGAGDGAGVGTMVGAGDGNGVGIAGEGVAKYFSQLANPCESGWLAVAVVVD